MWSGPKIPGAYNYYDEDPRFLNIPGPHHLTPFSSKSPGFANIKVKTQADPPPVLANKTVKTLDTLVDEHIQAANQKAQVWGRRHKAFILLTTILTVAFVVFLCAPNLVPWSVGAALGTIISLIFGASASSLAWGASRHKKEFYKRKNAKLNELKTHSLFNTIKNRRIAENANEERIIQSLLEIVPVYNQNQDAKNKVQSANSEFNSIPLFDPKRINDYNTKLSILNQKIEIQKEAQKQMEKAERTLESYLERA